LPVTQVTRLRCRNGVTRSDMCEGCVLSDRHCHRHAAARASLPRYELFKERRSSPPGAVSRGPGAVERGPGVYARVRTVSTRQIEKLFHNADHGKARFTAISRCNRWGALA